MIEKDNNFYEKFQDSHWVAKGSDPRSEQRVNDEFEDKFDKVSKDAPKTKKFKEFLENLKLLFEYLKSGEDLAPKALIIAALVYFISPIDLIPDFIPVAGYIDDIAVVGGVVALLANLLNNFKKRRDTENGRGGVKVPAPKGG